MERHRNGRSPYSGTIFGLMGSCKMGQSHHKRLPRKKINTKRGQNTNDRQKWEESLFTDLTGCETDVLKLIANGLTNSQMAEKLVFSENTVKGHVSNILSKLHLADRTKAAVYAWQQGIVNRYSIKRNNHRKNFSKNQKGHSEFGCAFLILRAILPNITE
jgi:DNA-binding CsgD family transcriptional regulator